jgi:shikimate dehydrogenase
MKPTPMNTATYCVMGNPVEHSRSPWIHARFAELTGQPMQYERRLVALDGFHDGVNALMAEGFKGCNVTVPFKFEAAALAQYRSERVVLAGAANVLSFHPDGVHADNTDGVGLVNDIQINAGLKLAGCNVLLLGAGGAAAGVLGPILQARPGRVAVANRTHAKAMELVQRHRVLAESLGVTLQAVPQSDLEDPYDLVINGTASSLSGAQVPAPTSVLKPGCMALDMMYGPAAQAFLDWAHEHGATGRDGLGMLVEQAAEAFNLWRGIRPPSAQVLTELRQRI